MMRNVRSRFPWSNRIVGQVADSCFRADCIQPCRGKFLEGGQRL